MRVFIMLICICNVYFATLDYNVPDHIKDMNDDTPSGLKEVLWSVTSRDRPLAKTFANFV